MVSTQNAGASVAKNTAAQEINARLSALHADLSMVADRMQRILDRAYGVSPKPESPGVPKEVPSGEIASITDRLEELGNMAQQQTLLVNRLDQIV